MDTAWRFRIMIFTVVALVAFGDFFGYGSIRGVRSDPNQVATSGGTGSNGGKFQQKDTSSAGTSDIDMSEDPDINELSAAVSLKQKRDFVKSQFSDAIKDSCLPKMLCEMASKPEYMLSEKEKDLMHLIRTSMSLAMNGAPSKWHFAAHMGELLRYTGDDMSGPMGCANLWPNCPISSKKLMKLTNKVKF